MSPALNGIWILVLILALTGHVTVGRALPMSRPQAFTCEQGVGLGGLTVLCALRILVS
jgi:hypothetical protein